MNASVASRHSTYAVNETGNWAFNDNILTSYFNFLRAGFNSLKSRNAKVSTGAAFLMHSMASLYRIF